MASQSERKINGALKDLENFLKSNFNKPGWEGIHDSLRGPLETKVSGILLAIPAARKNPQQLEALLSQIKDIVQTNPPQKKKNIVTEFNKNATAAIKRISSVQAQQVQQQKKNELKSIKPGVNALDRAVTDLKYSIVASISSRGEFVKSSQATFNQAKEMSAKIQLYLEVIGKIKAGKYPPDAASAAMKKIAASLQEDKKKFNKEILPAARRESQQKREAEKQQTRTQADQKQKAETQAKQTEHRAEQANKEKTKHAKAERRHKQEQKQKAKKDKVHAKRKERRTANKARKASAAGAKAKRKANYEARAQANAQRRQAQQRVNQANRTQSRAEVLAVREQRKEKNKARKAAAVGKKPERKAKFEANAAKNKAKKVEAGNKKQAKQAQDNRATNVGAHRRQDQKQAAQKVQAEKKEKEAIAKKEEKAHDKAKEHDKKAQIAQKTAKEQARVQARAKRMHVSGMAAHKAHAPKKPASPPPKKVKFAEPGSQTAKHGQAKLGANGKPVSILKKPQPSTPHAQPNAGFGKKNPDIHKASLRGNRLTEAQALAEAEKFSVLKEGGEQRSGLNTKISIAHAQMTGANINDKFSKAHSSPPANNSPRPKR